MAPPESDAVVQSRIATLSERGDQLAAAGNFNAAEARYRDALALVPTPHEDQPSALWLHAAIGDACYQRQDQEGCRQNMRLALLVEGGKDNAFVRLRLGQAALALGDEAAAERELFEAFRLGGEELFAADGELHFEWLRRRIAAR